jgi:hypothetical protein
MDKNLWYMYIYMYMYKYVSIYIFTYIIIDRYVYIHSKCFTLIDGGGMFFNVDLEVDTGSLPIPINIYIHICTYVHA